MMLWMLRVLLASVLLACATMAADEAARLLRKPRRWIWATGMAIAGGLPLIVRMLPAVPLDVPGRVRPDVAVSLERVSPAGFVSARAPSAWDALTDPAGDPFVMAIWLAATMATLAVLVLTCRRLHRIGQEGDPAEIAGIPVLLSRTRGPLVVGVRDPRIVVPAWLTTLPEAEQEMVVRHEWEHLRAGDTRLLLAVAGLLALLPWNLPLWWMQRRLRQAVEVDCDARVLAAGADRRTYGRMLIQVASRPSTSSLLAPALVHLPPLLEQRIKAMTSRPPTRPALRLAPVVTLGLLLLAAACELTPRGSSPSPTTPTFADVVQTPNSSALPRTGKVESGTRVAVRTTPEGRTKFGIDAKGDTVWIDVERFLPADGQHDRGAARPIVLVDGKRVSSIREVDPQRIESVKALPPGAAVARYGPEAKDGAVQVTLKGSTTPHPEPPVPHIRRDERGNLIEVRLPPRPEEAIASGPPLYFVDGVRVASIASLDPQRIEAIEVVRDPTVAVERFGAEARHGAVLVKLK